MELRHLRYFVAVAEELHFSRAAQRLHIAQPPLSQQIKSLEVELGARLFDRTRRSVALTEAGRAFLPEARRVLAQAERAEQIVRDAGAGIVGRLNVGFVTSASYSILPDTIRLFRETYPHVDIRLHEMIPARQLEALTGNDIDVGLLRTPVNTTTFDVETILAEPLVCALPAGHVLAKRKQISLSALKSDDFILFPRRHGPGIYDVIQQACHDHGFIPSVVYEPNEMQAILTFVAAGLGVSLVPASLHQFHRKYVRYTPLKGCSSAVHLAMIHDASRPSQVADNFRGICRGVAAGYSVSSQP